MKKLNFLFVFVVLSLPFELALSLPNPSGEIREPTPDEIEMIQITFGVMKQSTIDENPELDLKLEKDLISFRANYCQNNGSINCGSLAKYKGMNSFSYSFASASRMVGAKEFFVEVSPGVYNAYLDDKADGENIIDTVIELNQGIEVEFKYPVGGQEGLYPSFPFVSVKHGTEPLIYLVGNWSFGPDQSVLRGDEYQIGTKDPIDPNLNIIYERQNPFSENQ